MKKWHVVTVAAAVAVASVGAVGAAFSGSPRADGPVVVVPSTIVVANPASGAPAQPAAAVPAAPALPPANAPVLLSADFSSPDIAGWQSPLLSQSDTQPLWTVEQGALVQRGDSTLNTPNEEAYFLNGAATWNGVVLEADVLATSGEGVGLVWNATGDSFYRVQLFPNLPNAAPKAVLELVQHGAVTKLAEASAAAYAGYDAGAWQALRVTSANGRQQVSVNGAPVFDVANTVLSSGQVGLYAWADSGARFDNVRVQSAVAR
jgi:hypothetical protein